MFNINVIIEDEGKEGFSIFSPDINVTSNGSTICEAKKNFADALRFHLKCAPEEIEKLNQKSEIFLTNISIANPREGFLSRAQ
ncbi:MAG: type II toxin-antitoxin system HicB family antitoxin [Candidatus Pacearchaeota archaeon]|jgi:predicted RNase H-like HicB family nuclease